MICPKCGNAMTDGCPKCGFGVARPRRKTEFKESRDGVYAAKGHAVWVEKGRVWGSTAPKDARAFAYALLDAADLADELNAKEDKKDEA